MIKYKKIKQTKEIEEAQSITCDVCKKTYLYKKSQDCFEIQEFINIENMCGFGSVFGDGAIVKINICQNCFKKILGEYVTVM